jgi:hypothetical protein
MSKDGIEIVVKPAAEKKVDTDGLVEAWFNEFFPNSPVSRNTEAWNLLLRAKDILKQRLKGE